MMQSRGIRHREGLKRSNSPLSHEIDNLYAPECPIVPDDPTAPYSPDFRLGIYTYFLPSENSPMVNKLQLIHREPTVYPKGTKEQLSKLYMIHLCNFDTGSVIERYLPFYQYGREDKLKQDQRDELWEGVNKFVRRTELRHFRLMNQPEDFHMERVLAFYELTKVRWDKSPGWICKAYMTGFSEIEALLQFRRLGIALDEDSIMEYKKWYVKHFVEMFDFKRKNEKEGISFNTWYYRRKKSYPTKKFKEIWNARTHQLEALINRCPSFQIYGFKTGRSLDELLEREYEGDVCDYDGGQDLLEESDY